MGRVCEGRREVFGKPKDLPIIEDGTGVSMGYSRLNVTYKLKTGDGRKSDSPLPERFAKNVFHVVRYSYAELLRPRIQIP